MSMHVTVFDIAAQISHLGWLIVGLGTVSFFFSVLILLEDTQKASNRAFVVLSGVVLGWGISFAVFEALRSTSLSWPSLVTLFAFLGLIAPAVFMLSYAFSYEEKGDFIKKAFLVLVPYVFVVALLAMPGFMIEDNIPLGGVLVFGKGFVIFCLYDAVVLYLGLRFLLDKYHRTAGVFTVELRNLITLFLISGIVGFLVSLLAPVLMGNLDLFLIGYVTTVILLILAGMSAVKYNFWSFKVIATEFFISFVGLILLIELFFATSVFDLILRVAIAVLILFSSFFLVGSVKREFESRDKIARLLGELDRINARLKVLDKKKSEFLSTASHHLRDPLTSIQGYASMLMEGSFGTITPLTKDALGKIFESSKRLVTVISDFLDISNIESGDIKYVFADVDMKQLVSGLVTDMQLAAERLGLKLTFAAEGKADEQYITVGDLGKIRQVISNLIDNSLKYTPQGSVNVKLSKSTDGKKILFSVSDTGIGMSADTLQKIFKKFSRAEGVSKVYTEGTGLGLYVAKEIVKKHEGRIWAESAGEKQGSSFNLELEAKHG